MKKNIGKTDEKVTDVEEKFSSNNKRKQIETLEIKKISDSDNQSVEGITTRWRSLANYQRWMERPMQCIPRFGR